MLFHSVLSHSLYLTLLSTLPIPQVKLSKALYLSGNAERFFKQNHELHQTKNTFQGLRHLN